VNAAEPSRHGLTADLTAWKLAVLPQLEALLTAQIGPVARLLLRRIAADAPDLATLGERLLEHIPSPTARADFAASLAALGQAPETDDPAPPPLDPAFGAALAHLLAMEIGPIAAIVVKRALSRAADRTALVDLVAGQIEAPAARARFLDAARALADAP
jgi:serine/threonine-protein kinase